MKFIVCILYLTILGLLCFPLGRLMARLSFSTDRFPFRAYPFERNGKIYEKLQIRSWQHNAPDISRLVPGIVPRKEIPRRPDAQMLRRMVNETCVAELTHVLLCAAGLALLWLWPGAGGEILYAVYVLAGNVPFILIQRYNRPRLLRLLRAMGKGE